MISKTASGNAPVYLNTVQNDKKSKPAEVKQNKELDRLESLKEQIKNGDYKIDIDKTADSILEELI